MYKLIDFDQLDFVIEVILYKENITVYKLIGSDIIFTPNMSDVRLQNLGSRKYKWHEWNGKANFVLEWGKDPVLSEETKLHFRAYYKQLRSSVITKEFDGARLRYTARMNDNTSFHSGTATLHVAGKLLNHQK